MAKRARQRASRTAFAAERKVRLLSSLQWAPVFAAIYCTKEGRQRHFLRDSTRHFTLGLCDILQLGLLIDGAALTCRLAATVPLQHPAVALPQQSIPSTPAGHAALHLVLSSATPHQRKHSLIFVRSRINRWNVRRNLLGIPPALQ
ncbi:hypothetical protein HPB50_010355 [Hyalomma asiaticum]|uniref:Uncharacterized protein n=1 Tax=Hyalomma asiaticum TaxID=266040 RepID=A0ACB7S5F9_HYAAI|nr:hypothetical protein HPB50_010355 [Hyalomma asiaticum]